MLSVKPVKPQKIPFEMQMINITNKNEKFKLS